MGQSGARPYGDDWTGPVFVLTHHPEDATPADGITFLTCEPAEAVRIGLAAAGGKNLEVFSPTIGRQLLELGLVDEIDLHVAPVLLGDGKRLYDNPGGAPIQLDRVGTDDPARVRPARAQRVTKNRVTPAPAQDGQVCAPPCWHHNTACAVPG